MLFQVYMGGGSCGGRIVDRRVSPDRGLSRASAGVVPDPVQQLGQAVVLRDVGGGQVPGHGRVLAEDDLGGRRLELRVERRPPGQHCPRQYGHPLVLMGFRHVHEGGLDGDFQVPVDSFNSAQTRG